MSRQRQEAEGVEAAAGGGEENPFPSASSSSTTSSSATASALGASVPEGAAGDRRGEAGAGQGAGDVDEWLKRQMKKLGIKVDKERDDLTRRTRANPTRLGDNLLSAAKNGRLADVRRLLDDGADVNYVYRGEHENVDSLFGIGYTAIRHARMSAIFDGDIITPGPQRGADTSAVQVDGRSAMHWAGLRDEGGQCVGLLVAAGGEVDARDTDGSTPLHFAAHANNMAAVRALLSAGARKNLKAWGGPWKNKTPFDLANTEAVKDLLRL